MGFSAPSFFGGLAIGAALTATMWLGPALLDAPASEQTGARAPTKESAPMRYEFWERLPRGEVSTDTRPYIQAETQDTDKEYLVQAGSFRKRTDAETLRAGLLLDGLAAETTEVTLAGAGTWYRVLVGPYQTRRESHRTMTRLREQNISALLLERTPTAG